MIRRVKIYANFLFCFVICIMLYLLSTYFKEYTQYLFQAEAKYWNIEFVLIVAVSLLNGAILEYYNSILLERPEKIFKMLTHLIYQLYLFSIILFYIMMVANGAFGEKYGLVKNVMGINFAILLLYILYLWYSKKRENKKPGRLEAFKMVIGASLILQSSIIEIAFLGVYLLLLHFIKIIEYVNYSNIKNILRFFFCIVLIMEMYLLIADIDIYSKLALSSTNIFMLYICKKDSTFFEKEKTA